ncbi:MAG: aminoglycoside phosphotransferase family protein, partial [Congregibacter sp.]|nr:aminoglycoside phosphotransferase family protein [Congregibacter sp.]
KSANKTARHSYEVNIQSQAAACDSAPRVFFSDPRRGLTLMQYIDDPKDGPDSPAAIAQLLKSIHALPAQGMPTRSTDVLRDYLSYYFDGYFYPHLAHSFEPRNFLMASQTALAKLLGEGLAIISRAMQAVDAQSDVRPVLCHNDLLQANRLRCGDRLYALDWEYAAPGDPFFDIAVCASQMSPRQANALLDLYLRRGPTPAEQQRFRGQCLIYACIEACWFTIHHPDTDPARRSYAVLCGMLQTDG